MIRINFSRHVSSSSNLGYILKLSTYSCNAPTVTLLYTLFSGCIFLNPSLNTPLGVHSVSHAHVRDRILCKSAFWHFCARIVQCGGAACVHTSSHQIEPYQTDVCVHGQHNQAQRCKLQESVSKYNKEYCTNVYQCYK